MESGAITQRMLEAMRGTRRWVRFLAILLFAGSALVMIVVVFHAISSSPIKVLPYDAVPFFSILVPGSVLLLIFYIIPAILMFKYSSAMGSLLKDTKVENLERALDRQKAFWKYIGILAIIAIAVYVTFIVIWVFALLIFPSFHAVSEKACIAGKDSMANAVKSGIAMKDVEILIGTSPESLDAPEGLKHPPSLDSAEDGPAGEENVLFDEVLGRGITDPKWSKEGNAYTFECGGKEYTFEYDAETGEFASDER